MRNAIINLSDYKVEDNCITIDPFDYIDDDEMIDHLEICGGHDVDRELSDFDNSEIEEYMTECGYVFLENKEQCLQVAKQLLYEKQDTRSIICDLFDLNHTISKEEILQRITDFL